MSNNEIYRPNVAIVILSQRGDLLWCRRKNHDGWQFPQGGIDKRETPEIAMFRELEEEIGLLPSHVEVLGQTKGWLKYRLPRKFLSKNKTPFKGQKQKWFLLKFLGEDADIKVDRFEDQEFDHWAWVSYWFPLSQVVNFKRDVYRKALIQLIPLAPGA